MIIATMRDDLRTLLDKPDEMGREPKPVSKEDIHSFEQEEGVKVPPDLAAFWLTYGGRDLNSRAIFCFKARAVFPTGKKKAVDVGAIGTPHGLAATRERYLNPLYGNSGSRLPDALYPLTFDAGYGHCLLDLSAEHHGRILYIVIKAKTFGDPGYGWEQIGSVADSFSALLAELKPDYL